ncbi:MAG: phospholipase [Methanomicrobium sp.]|nr:phospholipase [Methanomicrobium sp.]
MHGTIISEKRKERRENAASQATAAFRAIIPLFILGILLTLCMCQTASAAYDIRITEFCPDTYLKGEGDEYFVLGGGGSLGGVEVSDGEGSVGFPKGASFSGAVTVAREGSAFFDVHGYYPDYEMYDTTPSIRDAVRTGNFQMGNGGDNLELVINGVTVQEIVYPSDAIKKGEGRVHKLDTATGVWDIRPYYIGQSDFAPRTVNGAAVTAFAAPDGSYKVFSDAVSSAKKTIDINVYELTNLDITDILEQRIAAGVKTRILLEGSPVGGLSPESIYAASRLSNAGADVKLVSTENGIYHTPYRFDHAKYMVIDGEKVLIASENFGNTGFPYADAAGLSGRGNRGFGALIESAAVAEYFTEVFETDIRGGWVTDWKDYAAANPQKIRGARAEESVGGANRGDIVFAPATFSGVTVTPVLSPDTSYLIPELVSSAEKSLYIEQAYITKWSTGKNPYLEAAIDAARRGVSVRVLLDSYRYNTEDDDDNDEMVDYINGIAAKENLDLKAALIDLDRSGLLKIHNKCVIADREKVLVSSVNWNENSPSYNREAGVILAGGVGVSGNGNYGGQSGTIGEYYSKVFDRDWENREGGGIISIADGIIAPDSAGNEGRGLQIAIAGIVILCFAIIFVFRKRRV